MRGSQSTAAITEIDVRITQGEDLVSPGVEMLHAVEMGSAGGRVLHAEIARPITPLPQPSPAVLRLAVFRRFQTSSVAPRRPLTAARVAAQRRRCYPAGRSR